MAQEITRRMPEKSSYKNYHHYLIISSINSTIIYILCFLSLYIINQLVTIFIASNFGIKTTLYYYKIKFLLPKNSLLWTYDTVVSIFSTGPFFCLFLGVLLIILFFLLKKKICLLSVFILWGYLQAFNFFFGAFVDGLITNSGVGNAINMMNISFNTKMVLSVAVLYIMVLIGSFSAKAFLVFSNPYYITTRSRRFSFLFTTVFMPWLIGSALIFLIRIPNNSFYDKILYLLMLFMIIPVLFNYKIKPQTNADKKSKEQRISWIVLIILIIVLIMFRFGFPQGINFR